MMQQQTFINDNTSTAIDKITTINPTNPIIRPFFQWVGGKRKIVDKLIERIPLGLNNYYEPFLGGGALFFQVKNRFNKCFLSDINLELVTSYNAVKKYPAKIIELCESYRLKHSKEYYNQVRDNNINSNDPTEITARFLYLNRYSFRVCRHEILAHISNPLRQRPAMYDFVFLAYLVAIPRHSLNF